MTLRLPLDQMRRLDLAAKRRKQSKQSFVQEITMAAVAEYEQGKLGNKAQQQLKDDTIGDYGGLGIVTALKSAKDISADSVSVAPQQAAPVVVQVGNGGSSSGVSAPACELDRLAFYVIKGDDFMRDARKRTVVDVLRASAKTDEEFNVLVARLEEIVAIKTKAVEENSGVGRLARIAFDKLTTLLGGE